MSYGAFLGVDSSVPSGPPTSYCWKGEGLGCAYNSKKYSNGCQAACIIRSPHFLTKPSPTWLALNQSVGCVWKDYTSYV